MSEPICANGTTPERLSAWRSRLLTRDEVDQLAAHVPECSACQAVLARFDRIAQAVRTPPIMPSGEEIWRKMQQRMNQQSSRPARQRQILFAGSLGAAALVILTAVLVFALPGNKTPNTSNPLPTALSTTNTTPSATTTSSSATGTPSATKAPAAGPTTTAAPIASRPYIYIVDHTGTLSALNPTKLQIIWRQNNNHGGGYTQPIIIGGGVYAAFYATTPVHQGSIFGFDAKTGAVRWQTLITGNYTLFAQENGVLFGQSGDSIAAIRMSDGHILWTYSFVNSQGNLAFAEHDGIIAYFYLGPNPSSPQPQVVAVDATTGTQKWSVPLNRQVFEMGLAAGNGMVFTYVLGGHVSALAGADGHQLWSVMPSPSQESGAISYDNGTVFASIFDNAIVAFNAQNGAKKWSIPTSGRDPGLPTVANGIAYVASSDTHFYAINVSTGALLWKLSNGESYVGQPVVSDGWVYTYVNFGVIQGYDANTGISVLSYDAGYGGLGIET